MYDLESLRGGILQALARDANGSHDMDQEPAVQLAKVWGMLQVYTLEVVESIVAWQVSLLTSNHKCMFCGCLTLTTFPGNLS